MQRVINNFSFPKWETITGMIFLVFSASFVTLMLSNRYSVLGEIKADVIKIPSDKNSSNIDGRIVYFQSGNVSYQTINEPDFGFSVNAGRLRRRTQYCQWHESAYTTRYKDSHGNERTEVYYLYHKGWSNYQINSLFFHNPAYYNPPVSEVPDFLYSRPFTAGVYTINPSMGVSGSYSRVLITNEQLLDFEGSFMSREFQYAGRNIFYRQYQKGFLEKLISIATFFDVENADKFDWCTPGDTRTWFEQWNPNFVSVLGQINHNKIDMTNIKGYPIGNVGSGYQEIRKLVASNLSWFPVIAALILHICIAAYIVYDIYVNGFTYVYILCETLIILCSSSRILVERSNTYMNTAIFSFLITSVVMVFALIYEPMDSDNINKKYKSY